MHAQQTAAYGAKAPDSKPVLVADSSSPTSLVQMQNPSSVLSSCVLTSVARQQIILLLCKHNCNASQQLHHEVEQAKHLAQGFKPPEAADVSEAAKVGLKVVPVAGQHQTVTQRLHISRPYILLAMQSKCQLSFAIVMQSLLTLWKLHWVSRIETGGLLGPDAWLGPKLFKQVLTRYGSWLSK